MNINTYTLKSLIADRFNEGELRDLCFWLDVDYDSLPGDGKEDKARELVQRLDRTNKLPQLVWRVCALRPDVINLGQRTHGYGPATHLAVGNGDIQYLRIKLRSLNDRMFRIALVVAGTLVVSVINTFLIFVQMLGG